MNKNETTAEFAASMDPNMGKDLGEVRFLSQDIAEKIALIVYPKNRLVDLRKRRIIGKRKSGDSRGHLKSIEIEVKRKIGWGKKKTQEVMVIGRTIEGDYRMKVVMEPENRRVFRVGEVEKYDSLEKAYLPTKVSEARQWFGSLSKQKRS